MTIDGVNQSEVWGAHRCGRRAYPLSAELKENRDGGLKFTGAHDGYHHLKGSPVHHRTITWLEDILTVEDRVAGRGSHDVETRLHINPELMVEMVEGRALVRDSGELLAAISPYGCGRMEKEEGWYCPEFGIRLPCAVLTMKMAKVPLPYFGGWKIARGH